MSTPIKHYGPEFLESLKAETQAPDPAPEAVACTKCSLTSEHVAACSQLPCPLQPVAEMVAVDDGLGTVVATWAPGYERKAGDKLYLGVAPAPEGAPDLRAAALAVLARWDSPLWRQEVGTAELMNVLRAALAAPAPQATDAELERRTGEPHVDGWPLVSGLPPAPAEAHDKCEVVDGDFLWLWKNGDHYLAFRHEYPCFEPGGDPMTLGQPFGRAIFTHSYDRASRAPAARSNVQPKAAEGDGMLKPLIYAAIMHNGKPKTVAEFERAAANVADMLQRRAEVTHNKPVASIYISDDGSREFDDWRVDLPPGNHQLFTAPRPDQPQPESLPHPGAPEAEEMIEKLLAEYNRPSNMKNAARAGYMAAKRLLQNARQPLPAVEDAEPIGWGGVIETCAELCDPHFIAQQDLDELKRYASNWNSTYRFFPIYAPAAQPNVQPKDIEQSRAKQVAEIMLLVGQYWDAAYVEGKEGRSHDTEDGRAQVTLTAIYDAVKRLAASPSPAPAPEVPAGMVLVPITPTPDMIAAGGDAAKNGGCDLYGMRREAINAYAAMLAAAPVVPCAAVGADEAKDAARWRAIRNHWKSCRFNFRNSPNVIKSVTLTINFDHDTGGDAKYIEHEFDAAIAAAPSISKPPVQPMGDSNG